MKDLTELRNTLIELKYLSKCRSNCYRVNYRRKFDFEVWKQNNNLWKNYLQYFLSEEELLSYLIKPKLTQEMYCKNCGKQLTFEQIKRGRKSCSEECRIKLSHDEEWSKKNKEAWKNKTPEELSEIRSRLENTMLKKYGVRHNWCNGVLREKEKQTWLEKYGVDHPWKNKEIRNKIVNSNFEKYGKDNYANRKKAQQTCNDRNSYKIVSEKNKEAWKNKTREDINLRTQKTQKTCMERYGTITPWYLDESKEKTKETCLKKYGVEHYSKSDIIKEKKKKTFQEHYGVDSPFQSKEILNICRQNNIKKYGYEWVSQSSEFQSKIRKKYNYDNLTFDSSDEVYFYIYHKEILKDNIQKGFVFKYIFDEHEMYYHCDFLIDDKNIEIKGNQYVKDGKLYFPYRNHKGWERKQKQWDAKFECMLKNNVKIILTDSDEMKNIRDIVNLNYTQDYVKLFNNDLEFPYINSKLTDVSDLGLIHHFHKSIYEASRKGKLSPIQAWKDKSLIKEIALNRLKYVKSCKPSDILQGFNVTLKAPKVSVFNPKIAEELIVKYLNDSKTIVDPFSGFSGRMIACEKCKKKYTGYDINEIHVQESNQIKEFKNFENSNIYVRDILKEFQTECYNALFTCPPYGGKEHWNENNDEVEKTCDEWIELCLNKFDCQKYLFVVDQTIKYKENIVQCLEKNSHFGNRKEYVILINRG